MFGFSNNFFLFLNKFHLWIYEISEIQIRIKHMNKGYQANFFSFVSLNCRLINLFFILSVILIQSLEWTDVNKHQHHSSQILSKWTLFKLSGGMCSQLYEIYWYIEAIQCNHSLQQRVLIWIDRKCENYLSLSQWRC